MNREALFYILICSITYGYYVVFVKQGLNQGLDPLSFGVTTGILSAIFSLILLIPKRDQLKNINKKTLKRLLIIGIIASGTSQLTIYFGQNLTSAVNAGFLIKLTAITTIPFSYLIVKEKFSKVGWISILITILGTFLLSTSGRLEVPQIGDFLIMLSAVQYGFTNAYSKKTMRRVPHNFITSFRLIFGSIVLIIVFFFMGTDVFSVIFQDPLFVLIAGLLSIVYISSLYKSIELVGPSLTSQFFLMSAIFTTSFAFIILEETINVVQIAGGLILLGGLYLLMKFRV